RNQLGDRQKALDTMLPLVESEEQVASDIYCLVGRIYKDIFLDSHFTDTESRDNSMQWFRRGFESEPTLHSGINYAVLLLASGHQFDSSFELRKVGVKLSSLLGKKGSLDKLQSYWDVGFFLGASILACDTTRVIQASEKLFRLKAPVWYLCSLVETILIYQHFKKPSSESPGPKQELLDFWMDFMVEATKKDVSSVRFPVLILEPTKVYQPSYLSINNDVEEHTLSIWHVAPDDKNKGIHEWNFSAASVRGVSISKFDERSSFLYVVNNSEDFQIYFCTEMHCKRFCELVNRLTEEAWRGQDEAECDSEALEYDYEYDELGERVVLGKGTFGIVYAGRDLSNQVRLAIKEIPERDSRHSSAARHLRVIARVRIVYQPKLSSTTVSCGQRPVTTNEGLEDDQHCSVGAARYSQPLHEEIALHKHLKHKNIVQYLGSISENGFIKIFMEQVPGGSLSALLRSKWGPLKNNEPTIGFYTKQILEGLKYLHDNQIAHRDIKIAYGYICFRLLEELLEKEREYQCILQQVLEEKEQEIKLLKMRSEPIDVATPSVSTQSSLGGEGDPELLKWLRLHGADADSIDRIVAEEYTLDDILHFVTRDDLKSLRLKGGILCKLWKAITEHREKPD
ncbi:hypothetical protein NFI96_025883, partial [Prochilodus magdalenae]